MSDYATIEAGPEIDALTAELVMDWRADRWFLPGHVLTMQAEIWRGPRGDIKGWIGKWSPSADPSADYEVLCHVRAKWDKPTLLRFAEALSDIIVLRERGAESLGARVTVLGFVSHYRPGDYARAALMAQEETT